jgi:biofilm PGA synthesis N-glycosyltransferase PgaC
VLGLVLCVVSVCGVNLALWGSIGLLRAGSERLTRGRRLPPVMRVDARHGRRALTSVALDEVAVMIPAHNEELVIAETVRAIGRLVPLSHVHVISDGSRDATAERARAEGAQVLEIAVAGGKARALRAGLGSFRLTERFRAVLLLDADTRLDDRYFHAALPLFDDPGIAAVAGCASTVWAPRGRSFLANVLTAHRERVYFVFQRAVKYGQAGRHTNVVPIVPGFASLYRTSVLDKIEIDAPGLVIEDFNMTFDLHHGKLGRVGFTPRAIAYTQDPHRLADYHKQVRRWTLGFWQTVRRHGVWIGRFWLALGLMIAEVLSCAVALAAATAAALVLATGSLVDHLAGTAAPLGAPVDVVGAHLGWATLLLGIVLPDYALTCVTAWCQRRPSYLLLGLFFLPLRLLDSVAALRSLAGAFRKGSSGRWVSPQRQAPTPVADAVGADNDLVDVVV